MSQHINHHGCAHVICAESLVLSVREENRQNRKEPQSAGTCGYARQRKAARINREQKIRVHMPFLLPANHRPCATPFAYCLVAFLIGRPTYLKCWLPLGKSQHHRQSVSSS